MLPDGTPVKPGDGYTSACVVDCQCVSLRVRSCTCIRPSHVFNVHLLQAMRYTSVHTLWGVIQSCGRVCVLTYMYRRHNPTYLPTPCMLLDPNELKPERWLGTDGRFKPVSEFVFPAFNGGPRLCVGKPLAYLEVSTRSTTNTHNIYQCY